LPVVSRDPVSVLFSEPKIPQCSVGRLSSARVWVSVLFSEPKIPQCPGVGHWRDAGRGFSALQRAENSSITYVTSRFRLCLRFQCSSASRKFLNRAPGRRASAPAGVSVLFSEPKIPQCQVARDGVAAVAVSVLFSEPKIPQYGARAGGSHQCRFQCSSASRKFLNSPSRLRSAGQRSRFSALQRAENSSIEQNTGDTPQLHGFSALQRAENSSMSQIADEDVLALRFSALQRAENSSIVRHVVEEVRSRGFSALQRAENSSIHRQRRHLASRRTLFQCSSASRKFLNIVET